MNTLLRATLAILIAATCSFVNAAQVNLPAPLDALLPAGEFAMVGGLKFDNFDYLKTGDMPAAASVSVNPITDGNGNPGLRFQGGFEDSVAGDASDALLTFNVSSSGKLISGAYLQANPDMLDGTPGTGLAAITETFLPEVSTDSMSVFDNGIVEQLSDSITFDTPMASLNVQKDILLSTAEGGAGAALSFVDQTFSMVPEPTSAFMFCSAFGLLGLIRRRR